MYCDICGASITDYTRRWVVVGHSGRGAPYKEKRANELCSDCVKPAEKIISRAREVA